MKSKVLCFLVFSALSLEAWAGGTISGTVRLQGDAPIPKKKANTVDPDACGREAVSQECLVGKRGGLQNAVVFIDGKVEGAKKFERPEGGYALDQKKCQFDPHILIVEAAAPIRILNSDNIFHNFHTVSRVNAMVDRAQMKSSSPLTVQFDKPEFIAVHCDIHDWMKGWIVVAPHPYYAVTDENGNYAIKDLPAGDYNVVVWHEVLGSRLQRVQVREGETVPLDLFLTSKGP